jgi:hypothetical protein
LLQVSESLFLFDFFLSIFSFAPVAVVASQIDKNSTWFGRAMGSGFLRDALEHEMFDCTVLDFVLHKAAPLYHRGDVAVVCEKTSLMNAMCQMVHLKTQQVVLVDEHDNVVALLSASRVCEMLERFFRQTEIASQHVSSLRHHDVVACAQYKAHGRAQPRVPVHAAEAHQRAGRRRRPAPRARRFDQPQRRRHAA